jgi:hypothetical protein
VRLQRLLAKGLAATAGLWPDSRTAYGWVYRVAHLLDPARGVDLTAVQQEVSAVLSELAEHRAEAGTRAPAIAHFLKVTASYWPGLFHGDAVADLPRTNNDLEQLFGSARSHERRATGRKQGMPGLVVRGAVRLIAAVGTPALGWRPEFLRPLDLGAWRQLRQELEQRHRARRAQHRFRRDPAALLVAAEALLL